MVEEQGVRPPSPEETERLQAVAEEVRRASREARLLPLAEVAQQFAPEEPGRLGELLDVGAWPEDLVGSRPADLRVVSAGDRNYLYSEAFMTQRYAETAALIMAGDRLRLIAATVRYDSATYPRPTPAAVFTGDPYHLTAEELKAAVSALAGEEQYSDIQTVRASDGSLYLFSTAHLSRDHAQALAEWEAVGQFLSP
ncbi:MAG TPA: hypothetical protein GXX28_03015 [Firmicutes bacterium]|nr:hypothetical protein [Bacillota bacterium]